MMKHCEPTSLSISASFLADRIETEYRQKDYSNHNIMAKINNMKNVRKYLTQSAPEILAHCVSYTKCNIPPKSIFTELNLKIGSETQPSVQSLIQSRLTLSQSQSQSNLRYQQQPMAVTCQTQSMNPSNRIHLPDIINLPNINENDKRLGDSMVDLRRTCEIRKNDIIFNMDMIKPYTTKQNKDDEYDINIRDIKPYEEWKKSFNKNPFHIENDTPLNLFDDMLDDMQNERINEMRRYSNSFLVYESMVTKPKNGIFNMDYINNKFVDASYITCNKNIYNKYIACSAPKPLNFGSWWNMIFKYVSVILALSPYQEKGRIKMDKYLPDGEERYTYGNITVSCSAIKSSEYAKNNITVKKITLIKNKINSSVPDFKVLYHIHYDGWADFGSPDKYQFEYLMNVFNKYKELVSSKKRDNHPSIPFQESSLSLPLIHCSAGVGRTGTFIAIHNIITNIQLETINRTVNKTPIKIKFNIVKKIKDMRSSRCGMVQTEEQFRFIYEYIVYFLESSKLLSSN